MKGFVLIVAIFLMIGAAIAQDPMITSPGQSLAGYMTDWTKDGYTLYTRGAETFLPSRVTWAEEGNLVNGRGRIGSSGIVAVVSLAKDILIYRPNLSYNKEITTETGERIQTSQLSIDVIPQKVVKGEWFFGLFKGWEPGGTWQNAYWVKMDDAIEYYKSNVHLGKIKSVSTLTVTVSITKENWKKIKDSQKGNWVMSIKLDDQKVAWAIPLTPYDGENSINKALGNLSDNTNTNNPNNSADLIENSKTLDKIMAEKIPSTSTTQEIYTKRDDNGIIMVSNVSNKAGQNYVGDTFFHYRKDNNRWVLDKITCLGEGRYKREFVRNVTEKEIPTYTKGFYSLYYDLDRGEESLVTGWENNVDPNQDEWVKRAKKQLKGLMKTAELTR